MIRCSERGARYPRLLARSPIHDGSTKRRPAPASHKATELRHLIAYVRRNVLTHSAYGGVSTLLAGSAANLLAAGVLDAFTDPGTQVMTGTDRRDATPDTLRFAVAFIDANPDVPLTLADIAAAAHVTPRALQLAFRRHMETTPLSYLRTVRLDHAKDELFTSTSDEANVSQIAARWGFSSSRLSRLYRSAYGESPSVALRR